MHVMQKYSMFPVFPNTFQRFCLYHFFILAKIKFLQIHLFARTQFIENIRIFVLGVWV